jgi:hypothetical protein
MQSQSDFCVFIFETGRDSNLGPSKQNATLKRNEASIMGSEIYRIFQTNIFIYAKRTKLLKYFTLLKRNKWFNSKLGNIKTKRTMKTSKYRRQKCFFLKLGNTTINYFETSRYRSGTNNFISKLANIEAKLKQVFF